MNFKDVELLSSYLDGQTSPSDSTRLESRLKTDAELAAAYQGLRESRGLLRRLPKRRAPRNFTLTNAMVGKKPPLPRSYPIFRFATALAAFLFFFSFATNRAMQYTAAAPAPAAYGIGGGDGSVTEQAMMESAPATEPPAALEPQATQVAEATLVPTATPAPADDQARNGDTPPGAAAKHTDNTAPAPFQIPSTLQTGFGVIALLGAASMFILQRFAANKWRGK